MAETNVSKINALNNLITRLKDSETDKKYFVEFLNKVHTPLIAYLEANCNKGAEACAKGIFEVLQKAQEQVIDELRTQNNYNDVFQGAIVEISTNIGSKLQRHLFEILESMQNGKRAGSRRSNRKSRRNRRKSSRNGRR